MPKATARSQEPPKTKFLTQLSEHEQEDPPQEIPVAQSKAPSRKEIESAIAVITAAFEQELFTEFDLDQISIIFPF